MGSCHLHGGGLGGAAAHRPGLRAAAGPSAAAPGAPQPARAAVADAVLVSHLHADHLHLPSLARLAAGTKLLVPRGAVRAVPGLRRLARLDVVEVGPGDTEKVGPVTVRVVPALHDGRRMPVGPRRSPALGFVVDGRARTYFAGDTGLFDTMAEEAGPVDVALLPVGGWGPGLGHHHLDATRAAEALQPARPGLRGAGALRDVLADRAGRGAAARVPLPGDEFVRKAAVSAPGVRVHLLDHGESVRPEVRR